ncbi:MAG TPA: ABC transporter substrate-binding protein [Vicinamibacterales bacterium]|nr:ABC transporter substrate-binding protein [Vicinamibacterales bacterium]
MIRVCAVLGALMMASAACAQSPLKHSRIGVLSPFHGSSDAFRDAFQQRLRELGYSAGRNITVEYRAAENMADRLPGLAQELVGLKVDAIVTTSAPGAQAAKQATATVPIVIAGVDDAVEQGFVSSLGRPGGNITGITWLDTQLGAKRLELLKQILPNTSRVALLREAVGGGSSLRALEAAARTLGIRLVVMELRYTHEIDGVFAALAGERVGALMVAQTPMIAREERYVVQLAAKHRLPTIFAFREAVEAGGLASYGPRPVDLYRRAADFAHRIINGAKPGEMPVEQPTNFELVINLRTAAELGIEIPKALLVSADDLIR